MCVPYNDDRLISESGTLASPFVIAIERANVPVLPHILNAFIFITVVSCGITSIYIASRSLTALSDIKLIPAFFGQKDGKGRPYVALIISTVLGGGLTYLNCNSTAAVVYGWFSSLVSRIVYLAFPPALTLHPPGRHIRPDPMGLNLHQPHPLPPRPSRPKHHRLLPPLHRPRHPLPAVHRPRNHLPHLRGRILSFCLAVRRRAIRRGFLLLVHRCAVVHL